MKAMRLVVAVVCMAAAVVLMVATGVVADDERTCTWVGGTEVCVPPRTPAPSPEP